MSADNWAACPQCSQSEWDRYWERVEKVKLNYGLVSANAYVEMVKGVEDSRPKEDKAHYTLREDYELGINDDHRFKVTYKARCDRCGFRYSFMEEEHIKMKGEEDE